METTFLLSFLLIIIVAVNLQLTLSAGDDPPDCSHELAIEISEQPEPVHCNDPSQELMILVESGYIYVNVTTCEEVTLYCTLNQPITWSYEGVGIPAIGRVKLIRDFHDCYTAVISVRVGSNVPYGKTSIGRYVCSSLNAQDNQIDYVQMFKSDTDSIAFVEPAGNCGNISYDGSNKLIIPCMANWPYVSPNIFKETEDGVVQIGATKYNPRTGFHLEFDSNNQSDAFGTYICVMGPEANASKAVFRVHKNGDLAKPIQSEQIVINVTRGETCSRFTCETRNKFVYELAFFPCQNIKHCEFQLRYAQLAVRFPEESTSSDICHEFDALPGSMIRDKTPTGIVICREMGGNKYNFAHHYQLVKAPPIANYAEGPQSIKPEGELMDGIDASVLDKIYYVNETLEVSTCYISEFVYAERPRWLVGLNGSTVLSWGNVTVRREQDIKILEQKIDITSEEMQSLICAAPRWDSPEWVNLTFPLEIKRGTPPKLVSSSADMVYVNGSEKVDFIFVQYSGEPIPEKMWKKDGKPIASTKVICCNGSEGEAQISFKGKPEEEAGLYECEVSNVAGSFTKTINVVLAPSPLVKLTTGMSPVVVALISIFSCALILLSLVVLGKKTGISKTKWWQKASFCVTFTRDQSSIPGSLSPGSVEDPPDSYEALALPPDVPVDPPCDRGPEDVEAIIKSSYMCSVVKTEDLPTMKLLKSGTFGIVYIIHKNGRDFALKRMRNDGIMYSTQLLREIETLDFLGRHENILRFQGVVKQEGILGDLFIVTDFCRLGDIGMFLEKRKTFFKSTIQGDQVLNPPAIEEQKGYASADDIFAFTTIDLIHWAVDCAAGMEFLARHGYAHGDLAPRNLLLDGNGTVKICDFGLSRPLTNENGTPCYILLNKSSAVPWDHYNLEFFDTGKITALTDIWAYGVTMWEIFELGKKPFEGEFYKYDEAYVEALRNGRRLLKPEYATTRIYEIMSSCWNPNPSDRPSFQELGELFQAQLPPQPSGSQANRADYVKIGFFQETDENSPVQGSTNADSLVDAIVGMSNEDCMGEDSIKTVIKLSTSTNAATETGGNLIENQMLTKSEYSPRSSQIDL